MKNCDFLAKIHVFFMNFYKMIKIHEKYMNFS